MTKEIIKKEKTEIEPTTKVVGVQLPVINALAEDAIIICKWDWEETNKNYALFTTDCDVEAELLPSQRDFKFCPFCGREIFIREYFYGKKKSKKLSQSNL